MSFNQMGFVGQNPSQRAAIFNQNAGQVVNAAAAGTVLDLSLAAGQTCIIPEGQWISFAGPYSDLQVFDMGQQRWMAYTPLDSAPLPISSDGTNYRFANSSGCPVGAVVTNGGTSLGATTLPTVYTPTGYWQSGSFTTQATPSLTCTPSSGSSLWNTFIGGNVSTSQTITTPGTGYTYAPKILVLPPSNQGSQPYIPATMTCVLSGFGVGAITVTNQGAGYVSAPTIVFLNQPGDTSGSGAALTCALANTTTTGVGQVTAVTINSSGIAYGAALTAVPTLAFAGTSAPASCAATALMNFSLTSAATGTVTAGTTYVGGYQYYVVGGNNTTTTIYTNPAIEKGINQPQQPIINSATTVVIGMNSPGTNFVFNGAGYQVIPPLITIQGVGTGGSITAPSVGGVSDTCLLYPI
jgi:hypothetical protein